jgi:hypothetical protein
VGAAEDIIPFRAKTPDAPGGPKCKAEFGQILLIGVLPSEFLAIAGMSQDSHGDLHARLELPARVQAAASKAAPQEAYRDGITSPGRLPPMRWAAV